MSMKKNELPNGNRWVLNALGPFWCGGNSDQALCMFSCGYETALQMCMNTAWYTLPWGDKIACFTNLILLLMTVNIMLWLWFHTLITCGLIQYTRVLKAIARELLGTETLQLLCRGIVLTCTCTWFTINQHSLVRLMLSSVSRGLRKSTGHLHLFSVTLKSCPAVWMGGWRQ